MYHCIIPFKAWQVLRLWKRSSIAFTGGGLRGDGHFKVPVRFRDSACECLYGWLGVGSALLVPARRIKSEKLQRLLLELTTLVANMTLRSYSLVHVRVAFSICARCRRIMSRRFATNEEEVSLWRCLVAWLAFPWCCASAVAERSA